jgi:hypothetical protein
MKRIRKWFLRRRFLASRRYERRHGLSHPSGSRFNEYGAKLFKDTRRPK